MSEKTNNNSDVLLFCFYVVFIAYAGFQMNHNRKVEDYLKEIASHSK